MEIILDKKKKNNKNAEPIKVSSILFHVKKSKFCIKKHQNLKKITVKGIKLLKK